MNKKQRENVAKLFYDMSKFIFSILVADILFSASKHSSFNLWAAFALGWFLVITAYLIDEKELK